MEKAGSSLPLPIFPRVFLFSISPTSLRVLCLKVGTHQATSCSNTSRRQITPCVQVAQILSDLIFCNVLLRQNSVAETKIFTKILQYTRSDLSLRRAVTTCCCNLSPSVYRPLMYGASDGVRYLVCPFWTCASDLFWRECEAVPSPLGHSHQSRSTGLHFLLSYRGAQDGIVVVYRAQE